MKTYFELIGIDRIDVSGALSESDRRCLRQIDTDSEIPMNIAVYQDGNRGEIDITASLDGEHYNVISAERCDEIYNMSAVLYAFDEQIDSLIARCREILESVTDEEQNNG